MNVELIIVGGGIAALATAWEALKRGMSFIVLHKPRAGNATQAAAGMLCPELEADSASPPLIDLANQSRDLYPSWIADIEQTSGLDCGYHNKGTLLVAQHRDHLAELTQIVQQQKEYNLESQSLSVRELRKKEPFLAPRLAGGLYIPHAHSIHPRMLYRALETILKPYMHSYNHIKIEHNSSEVLSLQQDQHTHTAQNYIVADGAWSTQLPMLSWLPLRPVKGQYIILKGQPLTEHTLRSPDVYMVPRPNGQLYIGASMEEEGFCTQLRAGHQLDLLYHAWQFLRGIYELHIEESGCGFRPALRDNQPGIGATPLHNLWLNIGHFRHGITIAPKAAEFLLHCIKKPNTTNPFSPLRFWTSP